MPGDLGNVAIHNLRKLPEQDSSGHGALSKMLNPQPHRMTPPPKYPQVIAAWTIALGLLYLAVHGIFQWLHAILPPG